MQESARQMIKFLRQEMQTSDHLEMREICAKFTTNVVASSVFGIDGGAFSDNGSNIRNISKNVLKPSLRLIYVLFIAPFIPKLARIFKVKLCQDKEEQLLKRLFKEAVQLRKGSNVIRQDFLEFLMQLQEKKGLSEVEIAAHSLSFFLDGVETSSIALSNIFYELAKNPKCQERLRAEMLKIRNDEGLFDYDSLKENKYLEQVIYGMVRKF